MPRAQRARKAESGCMLPTAMQMRRRLYPECSHAAATVRPTDDFLVFLLM